MVRNVSHLDDHGVHLRPKPILNFPELHGPEIATMMVAIDFLKRYPKEDRASLLHDHNDLTRLDSTNFIHFTAVAHAIAAITRSSMVNINSRFSEEVKAFQKRVLYTISIIGTRLTGRWRERSKYVGL